MTTTIDLSNVPLVTLDQADMILAKNSADEYVWVDPANIAQNSGIPFNQYLDHHPDIVAYWWPDQCDAGQLHKAALRCTDFNSLQVPILQQREGVRVYAAESATNENLRFSSTQTNQVTIERTEVAFVYVDPAFARSPYDSCQVHYCASSANYGGFRITYINDSNSVWDIAAAAYPYNSVSLTTSLGVDQLPAGWVAIYSTLTEDQAAESGTLIVSALGLEAAPTAGGRDGHLTRPLSTFRISPTSSGDAITFAGAGVYPAFFCKSRVVLSEADVLDLFARFKTHYGIE